MIIQTEYGVKVNDRIKFKRTFFFKDEFDAMKKAKELGTYHYPLYDGHMKFAGYGVPR